ncbi:MAG TPA: tetratricopeptide repeat protein [Candidatus Angelobacter sp.]
MSSTITKKILRRVVKTRTTVHVLVLACALPTGSLLAETCQDHAPKQTVRIRAVPAPILSASIALQPGIGNAHENITTSSPQAQAYYDQGLSYVYSYDWIHAARSFRQASRLDPRLAMAYLGLSYVHSALGNDGLAGEMVIKAKQLASHASAGEHVRIALREKQLQAMEDERKGHASSVFVTALDEALASDGQNVNLLLMRGVAAEGYASGIGQRGRQESIGYYEKVLKLEPDNAAAHHFLIHANEMVNNVPEAVKHAEIYERLAPSVAHAHHMYGHDLRRTDHVPEAIAQFEEANRLEEANYHAEPVTLLYDWNYRHNLNLLGATYAQAGLRAAAEKTFRKLAELRTIGPADDLYKARLAMFLLHEGRSRETVIAASALRDSEFAVGRLLGHALAGSAFARLRNVQQTMLELSLAEKEAASLDPAWHALVASNIEILRAQADFLKGERVRASARLHQEAVQVRGLPGSDAWSDAMFQLRLIGEIAIEAGDWELARFAAQQLLDHAPLYAGTHSLLARLAEHDGNAPLAMRESQRVKQLESQ